MKTEHIVYIIVAAGLFFVFPAFFILSLFVAALSLLIYFYFVKPLKDKAGKYRHSRYAFNLYLLAFCVMLMFMIIPLTKIFLFLLLVFVVYFAIKYLVDMLISFFVK